MTNTLHFTIGPVQGFVAQARRTRDLWAGSFLLSWLTGKAMKAVLDHGGHIVFPIVHERGMPLQVTDPLLAAIMQNKVETKDVGSIPNRFKAQVSKDFDPALCRDAVLDAWQTVADQVRKKYLDPVCGHGAASIAIWKRQVENFWEISWVIGPVAEDPTDKADNAWPDARKNWRTPPLTEEGGDHCTTMGNLQELSGYVRAKNRKAQDHFWKIFREQKGFKELDLRENERLCAISLIKRLFPRVSEETIGWKLEVQNWPSTSYMAAIPWIASVMENAPELARSYAEKVKALSKTGCLGETKTDIKSLRKFDGDFKKLDGLYFYEASLKNPNLIQLKGENDAAVKANREDLTAQLKEIRKAGGVSASPFYALLLMDGDLMGKLLGELGGDVVSAALKTFTEEAPELVEEYDGVTIYAGGDDLLALLPLDQAISAADRLRLVYRKTFDNRPGCTLSGAIVFAHNRVALRTVLHEAHHQLDDVAKAHNGRNSLAISVLKSGGRNCQWVSGWEPDATKPHELLQELAAIFAEKKEFSSQLIYGLWETLPVLMDKDKHLIFSEDDAVRFITAQFLANREKTFTETEAETMAKKLFTVCRKWKNTAVVEKIEMQPEGTVMVRFLAKKGADE